MTPDPSQERPKDEWQIGVFGYGSEGFSATIVMEAVAELAAENPTIRLLLLGAPREESRQGRRWKEAAEHAKCGASLRFTGVLDPERLQAALEAVDVVVFPDVSGPTSRKTTLAAALACGKPVVALDGPLRWDELVRDGAVMLAREGHGVATAIAALRSDSDLRCRQEEAALAFYCRHMSPDVTASQVRRFLVGVL